MPELRFQATPRQWALIGVLGALLIAVLAFNRPADTGGEPGVSLAVRRPTAAVSQPVLDSARQTRPLPEFTAEQVAAFNPFARPKSADVQALAAESTTNENQHSIDAEELRERELQRALAELRSKGVRFVIGNKHGGTAMLGNQRVRIGEVVNGFRVIKIDQSGVELQPAE